MSLSSTADHGAHCATTPVPADAESGRVDLAISGMTCGHCVNAVRAALEELPGVDIHQVRVGSASISLDPHGAGPAAVIHAIREAGYQAGFVEASTGPAEQSRRGALPQASAGSSCCSSR